MLLLLKLTLAPSLVALATLVARRWGPTAGGISSGFRCRPVPFLSSWALSTVWFLRGKPPLEFSSGLSDCRRLRWPMFSRRGEPNGVGSLLAAAIGFSVVSAGLSQIEGGPIGAGLTAYAALLVVALVVRRSPSVAVKARPPAWDLPLRMLAAALLYMDDHRSRPLAWACRKRNCRHVSSGIHGGCYIYSSSMGA